MDKFSIYEYKMTTEEITHGEEIAHVLKRCGVFIDVINPIFKDEKRGYLAGGDCGRKCLIVKSSEKEYGYDYYIIEIGDRYNFYFKDFNKDYYVDYKEESSIPYECLLYFFLRKKNRELHELNVDYEYVLYQGYCLKAEKQKNGYYSFSPIHGYGSGMAMDEVMQYGCSFMEPVFLKESCPSCRTNWWFNTRNIPDGETYECACPKCEMLLKRKKV